MIKMEPFAWFVDFEQSRTYIDELYSFDRLKIHEAVICLKNAVIGSNRQKGSVISQGAIPRLIKIIGDETLPIELRLDTIIVVGSLAKGTEDHVRALVNSETVIELLNLLTKPNTDRRLIEASMSALKSILQYPFAPVDLVRAKISRIIGFATPESSIQCQSCVANILVPLCHSYNEQLMLCTAGAIPLLARLMTTQYAILQIPALKCLASMCFTNRSVSDIAVTAKYKERYLLDILTTLLSRANPVEVQLGAARCLTYLHRSGSISSTDIRIVYKTLPCLARLCADEIDVSIRATAAETLAYLAEIDSELQRLAAISNHLINSLSNLLQQQSALARQGSFRCFASLGANEEDIRKRIIETDGLMEEVLAGLGDSCLDVRVAAIRCLHSLSRSVQQLRTTFQDHTVWRPLMTLLEHSSSNELLTVVTSTICNLLLEFSPAKEPLLENGVVDLLCNLTRNPDPALRLNGSWALMNMAFQAEQRVKSRILNTLGSDRIFSLLNDSDTGVIMKTLGLLRNLLSTTGHIDNIMAEYSTQVMQAVNLVLDAQYPPEVKEQALCIIGNIAAAGQVKDYIMEDEVILKKLIEYLGHKETNLQTGALFAINNLVHRSENISPERNAKLKEYGLMTRLEELLTTTNNTPQFYDDVRAIIRQIYP